MNMERKHYLGGNKQKTGTIIKVSKHSFQLYGEVHLFAFVLRTCTWKWLYA